jgi:hypothetical protein
MESVILKKKFNSKLFQYTNTKSIIVVLTCVVLILGYYQINEYLFTKGFASATMLYLGEKALLVFKGNPPKIENLGFVYPPIPYFFVLLFRNPFWGTAIAGGICATFFLFYIWHHLFLKKHINFFLLICILYGLASPLSLYLFSQQLPSILIIALILFSFQCLYIYSQTSFSIHLFLFGLLSALIFFVHFEVAVIIALWSLPCSLIISKKANQHTASLVIVTYFPLIFFVFSWCYLNWLFMENPVYFFHRWMAALFYEGMELKRPIAGSHYMSNFKFAFKEISYNLPLLLPYAILLFTLIKSNVKKHMVLLSIQLFPIILFVIDIVLKGFLRQIGQHFFLIFVATSIYVFIKLDQLNDYPISAKLFKAAFFVSLCYSFWSPLHLGSSEEILFTQAYYGFANFQNLEDEKKLLEKITDKGKILLDDKSNYSLVYLTNDPQRFILPYEHEFETVAAKPNLFVEYIVFSDDPNKDQVLKRFTGDRYDLMEDYTLVGQFGKYKLYKVTTNGQIQIN